MVDVKALLKRNRVIYRLNAAYKNVLASVVSARLDRSYAKRAAEAGLRYDEETMRAAFRERLARRGLAPSARKQGDMNIFWVGASREQDNSGFLHAMRKFGRVTVFNENESPYGPDLTRGMGRRNGEAILRKLEEVHRVRPVDILIGQMWANYLDPAALCSIQQMGMITVNVAMDDRLPYHWKRDGGRRLGSFGLVAGLDLVLNTSPECCIRYALAGCPAIYWPLAADPTLFRPAATKDIEVCFVGGAYGNRPRLIRKLEEAGIRVTVYGPGFPRGPVPTSEMAGLFARSQIVLGIGTIDHSTRLVTMKLRDFEATMAGAVYITHRNPDLAPLFVEDEEIVYYDSMETLVAKIRRLQADPALRERVGRQAAARARRDHTWEQRFRKAFLFMGLLADETGASS